MSAQPHARDGRDACYERLAPHNLAPLWQVPSDLVVPAPSGDRRPGIWHCRAPRPALMDAGALISAQEAVLFSFSDRPAQLSLGLWREERAGG